MIDYRSEFIHLWVLGGDLSGEELSAAVGDLERAARAAAEETASLSADPNAGVPAPAPAALPLPVRQFLAGLGFLREHLWSGGEAGAPALVGFLLWEGRLWALRAGIAAHLEQMTGAPARVAWHETTSDGALTWGEADASEVWRLECAGPTGPLALHARPPLASVLGTLREVAAPEATIDEEIEIDAAEVPAPAAFDFDEVKEEEEEEIATEPAAEAPPHVAPDDVPAPEPVRAEAVAYLPAPSVAAGPEPEPAPAPAPAPHGPRPQPARKPRPAAAVARPPFAWPSLPALPPVLRGRAGVVVLAILAAAAIAVAFLWAREPVARAIVGRYDLVLTTRPAGATVRVDGELAPGRTPMTLALEPGEHRIELTYGEYANAVVTVDGARGETVERSFSWAGSLALSSADTTARLQVSFDGTPWGALPLWKDDVPVGRHRLSFQGEGVRPWEEEVQIKEGQSTRLVAEPRKVPDYGLVTARAERVSATGVEDVEGASVFVDGQAAGATPLDLRLSPGPHSVRIASGSDLGPVHLIDVQPGGRFYASTTFGRPDEPAVAFEAPRTISKAKPPVLAVHLEADVPLPVRRMRLFVKRPGSIRYDDVDLAVAVRDNGRSRGTIAFPAAGFEAGATVRYYVSIETREGEEYFSEVRSATILP